MRRFVFALMLAAMLPAWAGTPPVVGRWLSGSGNGVIEIYPCAERFCGKLVWIANPPRDGKIAMDRRNAKPELRTRPLCGMVMLGDFKQTDPKEWGDGWIYSAENGKTYSAKITLESPDVLHLRGYIGIPLFGETQTWTRADPGFPPCGQG